MIIDSDDMEKIGLSSSNVQQMQTNTLDKLYLEWSQYTEAKTEKQLFLENGVKKAIHLLQNNQRDQALDHLKIVNQAFNT